MDIEILVAGFVQGTVGKWVTDAIKSEHSPLSDEQREKLTGYVVRVVSIMIVALINTFTTMMTDGDIQSWGIRTALSFAFMESIHLFSKGNSGSDSRVGKGEFGDDVVSLVLALSRLLENPNSAESGDLYKQKHDKFVKLKKDVLSNEAALRGSHSLIEKGEQDDTP